MAQVALVETEIEDGRKVIDELVRAGFPVVTACWMKTSEDDQWYLYVASPVVDAEGRLPAYRRVHAVVRQMPQPCEVKPLDVRLIGATNPVAVDILEIQRRYPGKRLIHYGGDRLGESSIEGAYIYPVV